LQHLLLYRGQLLNDLVLSCELQFYFNSLISPFYIWRRQCRRRTVDRQ
jgi:hypothetical protein